jgi:hypothetical protein
VLPFGLWLLTANTPVMSQLHAYASLPGRGTVGVLLVEVLDVDEALAAELTEAILGAGCQNPAGSAGAGQGVVAGCRDSVRRSARDLDWHTKGSNGGSVLMTDHGAPRSHQGRRRQGLVPHGPIVSHE